MPTAKFPATPKNAPSPPPEEKDASVKDADQVKFIAALHKAYDVLFFLISHLLSGGKLGEDGKHPLFDLWQDAVCAHSATPPETRKTHPQIYLRYDAGDHTDLLNGPAGAEIEIPLNKAGKPIKFTPSRILSKNCTDFRQYVKDQGYLPDGLCLLVFRQTNKDWTYNIIVTRDKNGPGECEWD